LGHGLTFAHGLTISEHVAFAYSHFFADDLAYSDCLPEPFALAHSHCFTDADVIAQRIECMVEHCRVGDRYWSAGLFG
jgi:hypothetical protein